MKTRSAAVEGKFYPSTKNRIFDQIMEIEQSGRYQEPDLSPDRVFGAVLPHAGHLYSGYQTIPFFQLIRRHRIFPETFVIIHPNHSGAGIPISIDESTLWVNSIGEVPVDVDLAKKMGIPFDNRAHAREHSAEVIIPFIQYFLADHPFSIVPVSMTDQSYQRASYIANQINRGVTKTGRKIMIIASCDFSHYLPPEKGREMDQIILDRILKHDAPGVEKAVIENHLSVCGFGPVMSLMEYARSKSADYKIEILARGHSGEVSPSPEVVDYISLMFYT
jgi:AmmeMemoRadiSam system protein B